jgi:poly(3-hydroxybutyrate) depolymerase
MRNAVAIVLTLLLFSACGEGTSPEDASAPDADLEFQIDPDRITVSGISSGAYMAGQFHVAHSALIRGAGLLAGGPWYCAGGSMEQALGPCVKGGDIDLDAIADRVAQLVESGMIDDSSNLRQDPVWIFHGAADETVHPSVSAAAGAFYQRFMPPDQVAFVNDIDVVHGMPTVSTGHACDTFAAPFLNACNYDAAGELLEHLYGPLNPPVEASSELLTVDQEPFEEAELTDQAWLYVPDDCRNGAACGLHVAFHGCAQSAEAVGDAFVKGAGFNEWAESNRLLVLYPQVKSSKLAPVNPLGCWDWWGYTGDGYATKSGPQIRAVRAMIDSLSDESP